MRPFAWAGLALSMTVLVACAGVQGSCVSAAASGETCVEYAGFSAALLETNRASCTAAGAGTWSPNACSRANAVGQCAATMVATSVTVFYSGTADTLRAECEARRGVWTAGAAR